MEMGPTITIDSVEATILPRSGSGASGATSGNVATGKIVIDLWSNSSGSTNFDELYFGFFEYEAKKKKKILCLDFSVDSYLKRATVKGCLPGALLMITIPN